MRKTIFEIARYYTVKSIRAIHNVSIYTRGALFQRCFYMYTGISACIRKNMKSCEKLEFYTRMFRKQDYNADNIITHLPYCHVTTTKKAHPTAKKAHASTKQLSHCGFRSTIESQSTSLSCRPHSYAMEQHNNSINQHNNSINY